MSEQTKAERREQKRRQERKHPVHGKSIEAILNSQAKRLHKIEQRTSRI